MKKRILLIDLGFGDSGKGTLAETLTRRYGSTLNVLYTGGCQRGHSVVQADGRHHEFSQFGSGSFSPDCRTLLGKYFLVDPIAMMKEAEALKEVGVDAFNKDRMLVDARCLIVTPFHAAVNRCREIMRENNRHGSVGRGIGETVEQNIQFPQFSLRVCDLESNSYDFYLLERKIMEMRQWAQRKLLEMGAYDYKLENGNTAFIEEAINLVEAGSEKFETTLEALETQYEKWVSNVSILRPGDVAELLNEDGVHIYEGAQGVLLDQDHGFHPYTTWSKTNLDNAYEMLDEAGYDGDIVRLGITRTYHTRHGAGPLPTESEGHRIAAECPEKYNVTGPWTGSWRVGVFDFPLFKYALQSGGGLDALAITHVDKIEARETWPVCYKYLNDQTIFGPYHNYHRNNPVMRKKQRANTDIASKAVPIILETPTQDLLKTFKTQFGPVAILSRGPTAEDKEFPMEL